MKREQQQEINKLAYLVFNDAMRELNEMPYPRVWGRLRSCKAFTISTDNYHILMSYNTIVACIDKRTDTLVDVLRTEYGYTSTSAQHIAKFNHDFCYTYWGCKNVYRTYEVK